MVHNHCAKPSCFMYTSWTTVPFVVHLRHALLYSSPSLSHSFGTLPTRFEVHFVRYTLYTKNRIHKNTTVRHCDGRKKIALNEEQKRIDVNGLMDIRFFFLFCVLLFRCMQNSIHLLHINWCEEFQAKGREK